MKLLFFCIILSVSSASAHIKIAIFDMETAIQATADGKAAKTRLLKEFKFMENKLKKQEFSLNEKMKDFDKKSLIFSERKRQEQQKELQVLSLSFQKEMQKFQTSIQTKQIAATKPIVKKLQAKLAQVAKKRNLDVILNKSTQNVFWAKDALDITEVVVRLYDDAEPSSS